MIVPKAPARHEMIQRRIHVDRRNCEHWVTGLLWPVQHRDSFVIDKTAGAIRVVDFTDTDHSVNVQLGSAQCAH